MLILMSFSSKLRFCFEHADHFIYYFIVVVDYFRGSRKKANLYGLTWGVSQCLIYFAFAVAFGFGGYLVGIGQMNFQDVFRYVEYCKTLIDKCCIPVMLLHTVVYQFCSIKCCHL